MRAPITQESPAPMDVDSAARWFVTAQPVLRESLHRAAAGEDVGIIMAELFTRAANPTDAMCRVIELSPAVVEALAGGST